MKINEYPHIFEQKVGWVEGNETQQQSVKSRLGGGKRNPTIISHWSLVIGHWSLVIGKQRTKDEGRRTKK